ncbi:matrixin [Acinetobacter sp. WC-323]|nr:matrixin [Acinetobacter sp. WC-323]
MLVQAPAFAQISSSTPQTQIRYSSEHPLRYRIADLDPRLNITQPQMIELSQQAAAIWAKDTGQQYFVYDPEAEFVIHLVFDQRQVRSMKRSENLNQLEQEQQHWLAKNQQLQRLKQSVADSRARLELQTIEYQNNQQKYQQALQNLKASAQNQKQVARLQQQHTLQQQASDLQTKIAEHNQLVQQFNTQTEQSKQLYQQLTESVAAFNQTFKPQVLHKGQFHGQQIFIYEFSSMDDLRLTLAHEFGHALGLKHTQDPKSLMYPRIKEQNAKDFQLTDTDLELLGFSQAP